MTLHLVRHAKAAPRSTWEGEDVDRPLAERGHRQAAGIAERFGTGVPDDLPLPGRVVSSPAVRCRQTVEPLAARAEVEVEIDERLGEGAWPDEVLAVLDDLPDGSVCCSHGDVIPAVVALLERRGTEIVSAPDWRKGSTWELTREHGTYTSAAVRPPP